MPKTIKMLKDFAVSPNGYDVEKWLKGEVKRNVPDALADDLIHEQTLAAIEVTGDKKADAEAEEDAHAEAERRAKEAAAAEAAKEAAAKAALDAAKAASGGAPKPPKA
jgi:FKBP-type peptidyl-prolyl cis-trans isomerase